MILLVQQHFRVDQSTRQSKEEDNLETILQFKIGRHYGIGHVRWATHGLPNSINAHPHSSQNVSVVHNGIIENSTLLKKFLVSKGHKFKSQTDTEVIVHLITENLKTENIVNSVKKTLKSLHGSFALGILFKDKPDLIVGVRRGSPQRLDMYLMKIIQVPTYGQINDRITYLNDGEFY